MAFLSNIGSAIKRAAPEMIRGALVAAANPTRGAVGTAGDIFGAIGAVEDDRMARMERQRQREMQELEMRRKAEEDARQAALNEARINEYKTRAESNQRRGTQQTLKKTDVEQYREMEQYLRSLKKSDGTPVFENEEDLHDQVVFRLTRVQPARMFNLRTPSTEAAQRNALYAQYSASPELQSQFKSFEAFEAAQGIGASKAHTAGLVTTAKKKAEIPFMIRRPIAGDDQYYDQKVTLNPQGTGVDVAYPATGIKTRQPAPRQATASDERLGRDKAISAIVNRVLKEDSAGTPETALRNVEKFYQNDPEVQQYKAEVMAKLQQLVRNRGAAVKSGAATVKQQEFDERKNKIRSQQQQKSAVDGLRSKYNY